MQFGEMQQTVSEEKDVSVIMLTDHQKRQRPVKIAHELKVTLTMRKNPSKLVRIKVK